jgi:outer membrane protein OmpA-like peptidoglycan-associated protein
MDKKILIGVFLVFGKFNWAQNISTLHHNSEVVFTELTKLNSKERECNISVSPDGKALYFMSTREFRNVNNTYKDYNSELFCSIKNENGSWSKPKKAGKEINSDRNEDEPSLSADGTAMYFQSWSVSWRRDGGPYYQVELEDGEWKSKKGLGGGINQFFKAQSEANFGYATDGMSISPNGNLFIVACGSEYNGNMDLYFSIKENEVWSFPKIFPVSTIGNERSAFIAADNKTVYFASNGYGGFGGMDLLKTTFENGKIGPIINIGQPFNTNQDDMGFAITKNGNAAFLIRNLDIYYADLTQLEQDIKPSQEENTTNEKMIAQVKKEGVKRENKVDFMDDDIESTPYFTIEKPKSFSLTFEFDKFNLTEESREVLSLVANQAKVGKVKIQLIGHTDNIGDETYNKQLSENRVKSVENWLKKQGIEVNTTDWKGEDSPKVPNSNSQNRSENRRVEIILEPIK